MKKSFKSILIALSVLSLASCGKNKNDDIKPNDNIVDNQDNESNNVLDNDNNNNQDDIINNDNQNNESNDTNIENNNKEDNNENIVFDQMIINDLFLAKQATCTAKALYYYSSIDGKCGSDTFEYGNPLGHNPVNKKCTRCEAYVEDNDNFGILH